MNHRVLLTGASGFIGRAAIAPLREAGFEVHAVVRSRSNAADGVLWHNVNLLDGEQTTRLMREVRPSHLLHFAWYAEPGKYWTAPENADWLRASLALLETFERHGGLRVVMAGTCAEYDWRDGICAEDSTPLVPNTLYGQTKLKLFQQLCGYSAKRGLSGAWGRIFFPYGPYEHPTRLISSVIYALLNDRPALCTSGEQKRDFIHVSDVAHAFVALLGSNVEGAVNIGCGQAIAVKDVAMRIAEELGKPDLIRLGARPGGNNEPPLVVADTRRLKDEVGRSPTVPFKEGLASTIDWWRTQID